MKKRLLLGAGMLGLAAAWSGAAAAQEAAGEGVSEERLLRFASVEDEVTVTATKNPTSVFAYPGSVSVIGREEIDDLLPSAISEIFSETPGVRFDGGPRRTGETPSVRGIEGEGVVVLFDGVRQSFLSGHDGRFFIEPDLLAAAEVVRGPGSALYGSGALGGVIAFRTLNASDLLGEGETLGVNLRTGYQSVNDEWAAGGTVFARSEDGRFEGLASLSYRDGGDIALGDGNDLQADDEIVSGLVKASAKITDALKAEVSWIAYRDDAVEPNNGQGLSTGDLVDKKVSSDTWRAALNYAPAGNNWIDAGLIAYINDGEVEESEIASSRVIAREVDSFGLVFDNRTRFAFGDNANVTFTYGGEYYEDEQTGEDNMSADGTRGGVPDAEARTYGLFVQAEASLDTALGEFSLIPAIRYDEFRNEGDGIEADDGAWSPKVGLSWRPMQWLLFYGNYAQAFRAPSFNELFADDIHFVIPLGPGVEAPNAFIPNPDLLPEESESWEVGAGLAFANMLFDGDEFTLKGGYYESNVTNLIDLEVNFAFSPACFSPMAPGTCNAGTSRYVNTTNAQLDGFEIEVSYDSPLLFAAAGYSSVNGVNKDTGDYVGILSPDRLNVTLGVKAPELWLRAGVRAEIAGRLDKVNAPTDARDGYETLDLFASWSPPSGALEGLRLDFGVDNILDAQFERVFAGVTAPGRNVKAQARWTQAF